jgi:ABC-2 type transport system ATP-binding protein
MVVVENLSMVYGRKEVLKDVSFEIKEGNIVGLLGANGAGKSTTMNILTGYLRPTGGKVSIYGEDIAKNPVAAKRKIGYLPEIPPLYKDMKVEEYLYFAAELKGIKERKNEVERVLSLFDLEERRYDFIKKLSKGLQQRVGFAYALLGNPPVLILDEPLVGLDPVESKRTRETIKSLKDEHIVIISSHILKEIEELCNDILILKDGSLVLDQSTTKAKREKNRNEYRLMIKGEKAKIEQLLQEYDNFREVVYIAEKEEGIHEFIAKSKNARDIRDSILGYLVSKKLNVYGIEKREASLEDVFMEMNSKEEQ